MPARTRCRRVRRYHAACVRENVKAPFCRLPGPATFPALKSLAHGFRFNRGEVSVISNLVKTMLGDPNSVAWDLQTPLHWACELYGDAMVRVRGCASSFGCLLQWPAWIGVHAVSVGRQPELSRRVGPFAPAHRRHQVRRSRQLTFPQLITALRSNSRSALLCFEVQRCDGDRKDTARQSVRKNSRTNARRNGCARRTHEDDLVGESMGEDRLA